jgi:integrase
LKQFSDFCQVKFNESDEEVLNELMKQTQDERIINAIDVIQLFINYLSKKVKPQTVKAYLTHVYGYFNYRGIKISSLDRKSIRYPRQIYEEKFPLSKEDIKSILDNSSYRRKTLYFVLLSSGMRIGETIALRKKDFDVSSSYSRTARIL